MLQKIRDQIKIVNFSQNANSMTDICIKKELERLNQGILLPIISKKKETNQKNNYLIHYINEKKANRKDTEEIDHKDDSKKLNDDRYFQDVITNMTLGCLRALDKAYLERMISERNQIRTKVTQRYKENKEFAAQQVKYYREVRLREMHKMREIDRIQLTIAQKRLERERIQQREKMKEERIKRKLISQQRQNDIILGVEFNKKKLCLTRSINIPIEHKKSDTVDVLNGVKQIGKTDKEIETLRKILSNITQTITNHEIDTQWPSSRVEKLDPDKTEYAEILEKFYKSKK